MWVSVVNLPGLLLGYKFSLAKHVVSLFHFLQGICGHALSCLTIGIQRLIHLVYRLKRVETVEHVHNMLLLLATCRLVSKPKKLRQLLLPRHG